MTKQFAILIFATALALTSCSSQKPIQNQPIKQNFSEMRQNPPKVISSVVKIVVNNIKPNVKGRPSASYNQAAYT